MIKVSDYIVKYLIMNGVKHVFGYPGGMVTHLMDSLSDKKDEIETHINYHEQACAFAGCGYAQASDKLGVVFATSGPGATNLITGICNAYYDSTPVLFLSGQVNTSELKNDYSVRQRGFQETDIVQSVKDFTKYAIRVCDVSEIRCCLDEAIYYANEGRKGPVLLDIPMNIQRGEVDENSLMGYTPDAKDKMDIIDDFNISNLISNSKRPCVLIGAGIKVGNQVEFIRKVAKDLQLPFVSSMLGVDILAGESNYFGFIGAYGHRAANFIVSKSDLIIAIGTRLDVRQVGGARKNFAPDAQIVRMDIDAGELSYKIRDNDINICCDVKDSIAKLSECNISNSNSDWLSTAVEISEKLSLVDKINNYDSIIEKIIEMIPNRSIITTDVGQNQVWVAQKAEKKKDIKILFSGGHGAMGYSLPAAIGAYYVGDKKVYSFSGDGGFQMNIQELQYIASHNLPVTVIVVNNHALGMIRHFQEMYFDSNYSYTVEGNGYSVPDLLKIAGAYGLDYHKVSNTEDLKDNILSGTKPTLIEIDILQDTYVFPKLEFGKPNQDQEPLLDRTLFEELMGM